MTLPNGETPGVSTTNSGKTVILTIAIGPDVRGIRYSIKHRRSADENSMVYQSGAVPSRESAVDAITRALRFMLTEGFME